MRPLDSLTFDELIDAMLLGVVTTDDKGNPTICPNVRGLPMQEAFARSSSVFVSKGDQAENKKLLAQCVRGLAMETLEREHNLHGNRVTDPAVFKTLFAAALNPVLDQVGQVADGGEAIEPSLPGFGQQDLTMCVSLLQLHRPTGEMRQLYALPSAQRASVDVKAMRSAAQAGQAQLIVVNLSNLQAIQKQVVAANLLGQARNALIGINGAEATPSLTMVFDEAHEVLGKDTQAASTYTHLLQTSRDKGLQLVCASQRPTDLAESVFELTNGPRFVAGVGGMGNVEQKLLARLCKRGPPTKKRKSNWSDADQAEADANNEILTAIRSLPKHAFVMMPSLTGQREPHTIMRFPA